jgi:uncharacterized membrane protein
MSFDIRTHTAYPAPTKPPVGGIVGFVISCGERIVTILAVGLGVLTVALIAVVMGIA